MKRDATDAVVRAFIEAVFPEAPALALAAFDEHHVLVTATDLLRRQRGQLAFLRDAVAEAVGYGLTGNPDEDDAQLIDRLHDVVPTAIDTGLVPNTNRARSNE